MWAVINNTPFAAERCWVRDKRGSEVWLVAVRGTFSIEHDGQVRLAKEQTPVVLAPKFGDDPATSGLLYDTDLHHTKTATDVLLHGHAYSPRGEPTSQVDVTLKVASLQKTLRVWGDRTWQSSLLGPRLSQPKPFIKMPLGYERAFGGADHASDNPKHHGWEARNPVGAGFATRMEHLSDKAAPNIESLKELIVHWKDRPRPAGFGPIAGHWQPRQRYVGTYDEKWETERQPLLPNDFDERYYQCAPEDQQIEGFMPGGEAVELLNLTPSGRLLFRIPRVTLEFSTRFYLDDYVRHRGHLHTVVIEPDYPRLTLVWHTSLSCHHRVLKLMATTVKIDTTSHESEDALTRISTTS